jgi:putative chitinase
MSLSLSRSAGIAPSTAALSSQPAAASSSGAAFHTVKPGETLSGIARTYGTTWQALAKLNNLANPSLIKPGTQLKIREVATPPAGPQPAGSGVTLDQLRKIMPSVPEAKAREYLPYLNQAMQEAGITTKPRKAAFLAQIAHESGELKWMEELASGKAYEGRKDLGNTQPGDGPRYKGRGVIQLTGRANYRAAGKDLKLDLEANPQQAKDPKVAFRIAGWYWTKHNLNALADAGKFDAITKAINGGYNGKADRDRHYRKALAVL